MVYQRPVVTTDNKGPLIEFSAYLLLTTSILTTLIKAVTKYVVVRALQSDDWFAFSALMLAVGQCVGVFQQVGGGLGQHIDSLTAKQIEKFQKAGYAVEIQYVLSIALAKMITLQFLATLAGDRYKRVWIRATVASNLAWALIAFWGVVFQCRVPRTWEITSGTCFNQPVFWGFISTFDILIDVVITVLPVIILHGVQMTRAKKTNAILAFAGRMLVIPVTILRLVYIFASNDSPDPTFDYFNRAWATEVATSFSIIFACISFIKPFLDSVETGMLASKLRNPNLGTSQGSSHYTKLQYAKNLFKLRGNASEERRVPLVSGARNLSGFPEPYELSNTHEAGAWSEPLPQGHRRSNDGITPDPMYNTRATDVAVVCADQERQV